APGAFISTRVCVVSSRPAKASLTERNEGTDEFSAARRFYPRRAAQLSRLEEDTMLPLIGKNVVVIGGSRGVGRRVVEAAIGDGARVLAVARLEERLRQLAREVQGVEVLALDATEESAPSRVFDVLRPDVLVVTAGALSPAAPLHELIWPLFSVICALVVLLDFQYHIAL